MNNIKILIVEDELIIAKNAARKLENFGYTVSKIVTSGQAAIEAAVSDRPDLILMDIAIKGKIDGIETAKQIKDIANIPFIFLTAYADDAIIEKASQVGCYGYLIKPFRDKELQATIKVALKKHEEHSTIQKALQSTVNEYSLQYENVYKDNLTNLPNQLFLRDIFNYFSSLIQNDSTINLDRQETLSVANDDNFQLNKLELIGVFNINLDRLSKVSSFLTKEQQDNLVCKIAQRLSNCVADFDSQAAIVYLEKHNYVVVSALKRKQQAQNYGQEIIEKLTQAFDIDRQEIFLTTSIGIAFSPLDSQDIEVLLEQSTKAREYAQKQGSNRCQLFTFAFNIKNSQASTTLVMESYLYHALERRELELYYQPKVNLKNNLITGAEALLRWNHPVLGRISADKFIPLAEESGLIRPISEWVLDSACQQAKVWHELGLSFLKIGINISGFQFRQSDLFHKITQTLFQTSLEPESLELELTEKILVENIKTNIQRLNLLKKIGIKIALDDFGTGYSSLGYLQQFPFDILKIDSCFIRDIDSNKTNAVITKNTIDMAHQLGLKVVAEGVETERELQYLQKYECDEVQGYIYSRPLPAKEFRNLVFSKMTTSIN